MAKHRNRKGQAQPTLPSPLPVPQQQQPARQGPTAGPSGGRTVSATHVSFESWQSGAIPPPGALARYGEVVPDGANRLFTIFEEQTRHRMKMENRVIGGDVRRSWMGLAAGLVVAVTGLVVSGWAIISGHGVEGTILGTADMGALVYAFIFGGNRQLRERLQKYEDTPRRQRK